MGRACMRCGADMILGCDLGLITGLIGRQQFEVSTTRGSRVVLAAVCPECGMVEPYVQSPKGLIPPKVELPPVEEEPPKAKKEPWLRKKKDDPWEG